MYRYFVFSDAHGCYDALISSLEAAGFDKDNSNHILIGAGDYFDRGDRNAQIYKFLFSEQFKAKAYLIRGNHDDMLKDFLNSKSNGVFDATYNGLNKTIGNFAKTKCNITMLEYDSDFYVGRIMRNYPNLMKFLNSMLSGLKIDNYIITHAGFTKNNRIRKWEVDNWSDTPTFVETFEDKENTYIVGHWHAKRLRNYFGYTSSNETFKHKNFIGIDACTNLSGFINIYTIESDSLPEILEY
jgi:serine/threonine protein phosphatase 1